jgi:hypothetical protein
MLRLYGKTTSCTKWLDVLSLWREFWELRQPLSCGVLATLLRWTLCFVVDRFSAFSDKWSLKAAKLSARRLWFKLKLCRKQFSFDRSCRRPWRAPARAWTTIQLPLQKCGLRLETIYQGSSDNSLERGDEFGLVGTCSRSRLLAIR